MSQRELARTSDISYTQVGDLEGGTGGHPSPLTLRAIARGLATDALDPNDIDFTKADAYYRQFMQAAGYLRGLAEGPDHHKTSEEDVLDYLRARSGDWALPNLLIEVA